jgi:Zn-dependent protease with chaperone function
LQHFRPFLFIFLFTFSACIQKLQTSSNEGNLNYDYKSQIIGSQFLELPPHLRKYLDAIVKSACIDIVAYCREISVHVVKAQSPKAWVADNQTIVLSSALLKLLKNHNELSFVIFHEVGHINLEHSLKLGDHVAEYSLELEIEADKYALVALAKNKQNLTAFRDIFLALEKYILQSINDNPLERRKLSTMSRTLKLRRKRLTAQVQGVVRDKDTLNSTALGHRVLFRILKIHANAKP